MMDAFACQRCGACCRAPGYVILTPTDIETIAAFLEMDVYTFTEAYTCLTYDRYAIALTEHDDGGCIFLEPDNSCRIQAVKPQQCIDFPFKWRTKLLDEICPALRSLQE